MQDRDKPCSVEEVRRERGTGKDGSIREQHAVAGIPQKRRDGRTRDSRANDEGVILVHTQSWHTGSPRGAGDFRVTRAALHGESGSPQ